MTEHVLGVSDDVEDFVKVFEEKRKAAHSLTAGEKSLPRFVFADIVNWKRMLQQVCIPTAHDDAYFENRAIR